MTTHHFGQGSFKNELWVNNKSVFKNPIGVDVEFVGAGAFDWVFADENGKEIRTLREENAHGGWHSMDFKSLGLFNNYSVLIGLSHTATRCSLT